MRSSIPLLVLGCGWMPAISALAIPPLHIDFEQGNDLAQYEPLDCGKLAAAVIADERGGGEHCLQVRNPTPATECGVRLKGPVTLTKNLRLSFDYRLAIEPGAEGAYLGMIFQVEGKQWFWHSDLFTEEWRHSEILLSSLSPWQGHAVRPGLVFSGIQLYGRVKDKTPVKGETKARITLYIDNLCLDNASRKTQLTDRVRESTANPPMFQWSRFDAISAQRIEYARDPGDFDNAASVDVDTRRNFYTPAEALDPGTWYWRVWTCSELFEGYSDIERVVVLPEAHRFTTSPIHSDSLQDRPRPRLLAVAQLTEPDLTEARKQQLVRNAEKLYQQGVPEHPGPHVPGDPRWPTWIDWYGKVAGGITGGTGRRLEQIARYAMLTRDPRVTAWAKELALQACRWDPEGGSAMRHGDIGAHHLLRGLNWCYDACYDSLSASEQEQLRGTIIRRAEQFERQLSPFRGSEANNHAWLQAFGLAESGLVLLGEQDAAADWLEFARQLYLGRFLACLGYQGENNEGIAYWGYGLGFVIDYADMMKAVFKIDLYRHPWLGQTARFPMYCAPPGAWAISFADTGKPNHSVRGPAETREVRELALRTRDPYALWYAGERKPLDGLSPQPPSDLAPSIHYRHIGWAIFNTSLVDGSEGASVALHSGRYFAGHQHPDQNSIVIHAYGEKLAIDGGYYDWWGSPHFDAYSMSTLAHNTLLVNGEGQAVRKVAADGRISHFFDTPGYGYVVGDAAKPEIYKGKLSQFDRRVLFVKPGFVVIQDLIRSSSGPARYDWMLHAIAPIQTEDVSSSFAVSCPGAALRGRLLAPADVRLKVTTGFPVEPVDGYSTRPVPRESYFPEWHLYASPPQPAQATEILAVMQIQRLKPPAETEAVIESVAADGAHGVRIRCADRKHLILFRKQAAEGPLRCEGLETDGDAAAVEIGDGGEVLRAMAVGARKLQYDTRCLFEAAEKQDWTLPVAEQ